MSGSVKKALIVSNNFGLLKALKVNFKIKGYDVLTTQYGSEAIRLVESKKPDIVLLDLVAPMVDGFNLLKDLRAFSKIPVIATGANDEMEETALEFGADVFILKPFDFDKIVNRIFELLQR